MNSRWFYTRLPEVLIEVGSRKASVASPQDSHFHDEIQVVVMHAGWRSFLTPAGTYYAEAGDIAVIPAGMLHVPTMSSCSSVTNLYLDPSTAAVSWISRPFVLRGAHVSRAIEVIDAVVSAPARCRSEPSFHMLTDLQELVTGSALSIADIAQRLGFSTDGFIRNFRRGVGTTPACYRRMHKLCRARSLLRSGSMPADAAFASSFADQSHLGRLFLRAFGTTPAAYRSGFLL
jgi:AraC-like DNA-binding protein